MEFKGQCKDLPLSKTNSTHQHRLVAKQLESSFAEKNLGILVDTCHGLELDDLKGPFQPKPSLAAKKVNCILAFIRKSTTRKLWDVTTAFYVTLVICFWGTACNSVLSSTRGKD